MITCTNSYHNISTHINKTWKYDEYYVGDEDKEKRRSHRVLNQENHWTGAESLECYKGDIFRETMHGIGEYRWRYLGPEGIHLTYEGRFYCNRMHGYGTISYPDGKVFTGLFHSNTRWGPGVQSQPFLKQDVGVWRDTRLLRLSWRPQAPSITPDFCATAPGRNLVEPHRKILCARKKTIGDTNSALDLLKRYVTDPIDASERWPKLYPDNCTDLASALCHVDAFEFNYYKGNIPKLEEEAFISDFEKTSQRSVDSNSETTYYAWNNDKVIIHMMKHSYTHDCQRNPSEINVSNILAGTRARFKPAGKHETDCRSLLMTSYLGHISKVVQFVNEFGVDPDIADSSGNTAIMYAMCGDNTDIIHFLIGAGAGVDGCNDACCTPLGVALLRYLCASRDVSLSGMVQALLPPPVVPAPPLVQTKHLEWNMVRDPLLVGLTKVPSKTNQLSNVAKKVTSMKELMTLKKKNEPIATKSMIPDSSASNELFTEEEKIYNDVNNAFVATLNEAYIQPSGITPIPYLFEASDMAQELNIFEEETKKPPAPKKNISKVIKDSIKTSKDTMWNSEKDELSPIDLAEQQKQDMLARIMLTIIQLLMDGANPKLVIFPQSALFIAVIAGNSNLVEHLVDHGADINETYDETYGYSPLDLAISRPFTFDNLDLIRTILECGANTNRRLSFGDASSVDSPPTLLGPTLMHAVLARKPQNDTEDEVRIGVLELLLEYKFDPVALFQGHSAVEIAMTQDINLLDVFMKSATTNLNATINEENQTILLKMFSMQFFRTVSAAERLSTLTNLLLFGADPLLECRNGNEIYPNIFVYGNKVLNDWTNNIKTAPAASNKDSKKAEMNKKAEKPKKEATNTKIVGKVATDDVGDYKQAIELVIECARLLHVRWLQAKLMKELISIIDRYKHRHWILILKEIRNKKSIRLWLTPQRCLEIWDIIKETRKRQYKDNGILKRLLYITMYFNSKTKVLPSTKPTNDEKHWVECCVTRLLLEHERTSNMSADLKSLKKPYVKPELTLIVHEYKFHICFECALPFSEERIECSNCRLVSFCSMECMKINSNRANCHPCSDFLKLKYFPQSSLLDDQII